MAYQIVEMDDLVVSIKKPLHCNGARSISCRLINFGSHLFGKRQTSKYSPGYRWTRVRWRSRVGETGNHRNSKTPSITGTMLEAEVSIAGYHLVWAKRFQKSLSDDSKLYVQKYSWRSHHTCVLALVRNGVIMFTSLPKFERWSFCPKGQMSQS